jgi:bifunctional enzyme CysN/CysC/sulfate adenylyltransferase subunit 1
VRDALIARGERAVAIDDSLIPDPAVAAVVRALDLAGVTAVSSRRLAKDVVAAIEGFAPGAVRVEDGADEEAIFKSLTGRL